MYKTKVDFRSRKAMTEFLENHFRYSTMNSWNGSSSYANNVKVWNLDLTEEQRDKFFELLNSEDNGFFSCYVDTLIDGFREETGYTAGFNGRSGGYLVMYDGVYEDTGYKVYPGRSIDQDVDWPEYSLDYLKERVKLVQRFDELCDDIRNELVYYLDSHKVVEKEYKVTKTTKVFEEIV